MTRKGRIDLKGILADPDLRRRLMVPTIQATQAREGIETTKEQADRAYYVVTEGDRASFFDLGKYRGGKGEPDRRHEMFVSGIRGKKDLFRFDIAKRDFATIPSSPLAYDRVGLTAHLFREFPALDPAWGVVAQGLATADDSRFVRCWWEVPQDGIGKGKEWVSFAKGGEFSRFYEDLYLVVRWKNNGEEIRSFPQAYIRNESLYFRSGITWSYRSVKGFSSRHLPGTGIHGHVGHSAFPDKEENLFFLLGCFGTRIFEFLIGLFSAAGKHEVGMIKKIPVPNPSSQRFSAISESAQSLYETKSEWDQGNEIASHFVTPWLLMPSKAGSEKSISIRLDQLDDFEGSQDIHIQRIYEELNNEVYRLYGIPDAARKTIEETLGDRPPEIIWPQMEGKITEQKRMEHVWRLLSYIVKRIVEADEEGIVPFEAVSGKPALMDRVYRELEALFPRHPLSQVEVEIANELKPKVKGYRSANSIREWLEEVYFQYHVSLYKNRPIFWHIASKQGKGSAFSAFVHYHRFDKNGMAKLRGTYLREAMDGFRREAALAAKEGRQEDRVEGQARMEETTELDRKLQLIQEGRHEGEEGGDRDYRILTPWKSGEERPKGWDPDIDDGVKVNIKPLQKAGVLRIATKVVST